MVFTVLKSSLASVKIKKKSPVQQRSIIKGHLATQCNILPIYFECQGPATCNHIFTLWLGSQHEKSPPLSHCPCHSSTHSSTSPCSSHGEGRHQPIQGGRQGLGGLESLRGGMATGLQRVNRTLGDGGMEEKG